MITSKITHYLTEMTGGGNLNADVTGALVPDGGWGWVVVFSSFMIHFIMDGYVV